MRRMCNKKKRVGCCFKRTIISVLACLLGCVVSAFQHTTPNNIISRPQPGVLVLQWNRVQRRQNRRPSSVWEPLYGAKKDALITKQNEKYLRERFGFTEDKLQQIRIPGRNLAPKLDYLQDRLLLDEKQLRKLILSAPQILTYSINENIEPNLDWLQQRLDLDDEALSKMIKRQPSILGGCSVTDNLEPKLNYLQDRLLLDDKQLRKVIFRAPNILSFSIKENIEPTLDWLQRRLDMMDNTAAFGKIIRTHPNIIHYSVKNNLEPTWKWLQKSLNLDDAEAANMIRKNPSILSLSIDGNLQLKLVWIQQHLSLTDEGLSKFVRKYPSILGLSVTTNLEPTLKFYIDALEDEQKALTLVTQNPTLFGFSLERRLKPRLEEVRNVGIPVDTSSLHKMGFSTDDKWHAFLLRYR